ncbi:hypothetical protein J6590_086071 [Homalodisca vitripennis]|nr:hypothetical protein J6590_086071 [Homalodisca vitripennis]
MDVRYLRTASLSPQTKDFSHLHQPPSLYRQREYFMSLRDHFPNNDVRWELIYGNFVSSSFVLPPSAEENVWLGSSYLEGCYGRQLDQVEIPPSNFRSIHSLRSLIRLAVQCPLLSSSHRSCQSLMDCTRASASVTTPFPPLYSLPFESKQVDWDGSRHYEHSRFGDSLLSIRDP